MSATRTYSRSTRSNQSGRSRSSSRSRSSGSRSRSPTYKSNSDSYTSEYSDDFETEAKVTSQKNKKKKSPTKKTRKIHSSDRSTIDLHSSATSRKTYGVYGNIKKKTIKHVWESGSPPKNKHKLKKDSIASHMLIAKQQELNDLQNDLFHAKQRLANAEKENKLLKTLQRRQDKAIRKFETAENDIPRLISRNFEDQRVLKTRLRRTQETKRELETKLNENSEEMLKMEGVLRRLKRMVYDKNLGERSELSKQLNDAENNFTRAERRIKELDRKLELSINNCTRQLNTERQKHKETRERLELLHQEYLDTDAKLKEKERALNVSNIYTLRKKSSPEKALVPLAIAPPPKRNETSSATQTDFAITARESPKLRSSNNDNRSEDIPSLKLNSNTNFNTSPAMNRLHSDSSRTVAKKKSKRDKKQSIFLTADFDSPISSPNPSFYRDETSPSTENSIIQLSPLENLRSTPTGVVEVTETNNMEENKLKSEAAQKHKANLLSKIKEIDDNDKKSSILEIPKSSSPEFFNKGDKQKSREATKLSSRSKAELVQSLLGNTHETSSNSLREYAQPPSESTPKKPEREISFGSYAPTVGSTPARQKKTTASKPPPKPITPTSEVDEPLFDLNSGKQNKKSDLLTQLFGNQDGVLVNGNK